MDSPMMKKGLNLKINEKKLKNIHFLGQKRVDFRFICKSA